MSKELINRWGNYASLTLDPVDDSTFWYTGEYVRADGRWATRIGTFAFLPTVTGVRIGSTASVHADYDIPDGSGEQIRTVPVGRVDQVQVVFSEYVSVQQSNLTLDGSFTGNSYTNISGFNYNSSTFTAT